jgi:adenine-specific DNA-methyltransferase
MPEKLKMHTPDHTAQNIQKLAELFPGCVTEIRDEAGKVTQGIDFDQLRQELSGSIVEGPRERYHLDWPGKRGAIIAANTPVAKTLRPSRNESVNFDTTKNLFIEGDNLEALKLLQETYLGKIKLIYIDPPYNDGKDRIYKDSFEEDAAIYAERSGQQDQLGQRLLVNSESNGRFHSDWLTMMYARLKLARNLLADDGVIFVSIDDNEADNLQKICLEIFGEENLIGRLIWKNATDNNPSRVAIEHEYICAFARVKSATAPVWKTSVSDVKSLLIAKAKELLQQYAAQSDQILQEAYSSWFSKAKSQLWPLDGYKFIDRGGIYAGIRGVHNPGKEGYRYDVLHPVTGKACTPPLMGYRFPKDTMDRLLAESRIIFGEDHTKLIELKAYVQDFQDKLSSVIEIDGRSGAYDLRDLFPEYRTAFDNPKPVRLLEKLISFAMPNPEGIFLDFFAGSGSSCHALMAMNAADGGQRRYIAVQLPELCKEGSDPAKAGIRYISEITKARLVRAGEALRKRLSDQQALVGNVEFDSGLRVLKIDTSNMLDIFYMPDAVAQTDLLGQVDNIRSDRSAEDLLFQVLVDWGLDLALPIAEEMIESKQVFFVDQNALAACFDTGVTDEMVKAIAQRKPLRAVFRDSSYGTDSVKINVEQIFKLLSPETEVRSI